MYTCLYAHVPDRIPFDYLHVNVIKHSFYESAMKWDTPRKSNRSSQERKKRIRALLVEERCITARLTLSLFIASKPTGNGVIQCSLHVKSRRIEVSGEMRLLWAVGRV